MATIDISSKLGKDKKQIKLAEDKVFDVDTSADTYLIIQEKFEKEDFSISSMYEMIKILMGEKALKEIKDMKLSVSGLKAVITAISALVCEEEYEEMEKRFQ